MLTVHWCLLWMAGGGVSGRAHSNLVPWQLVCQATGAKLRHVGLTKDTQEVDLEVRKWGIFQMACHFLGWDASYPLSLFIELDITRVAG